MLDTVTTTQDVIGVLRETLQLGEKARGFTGETRLLGHLPELDSMAVVAVITALEERFGIAFDDDEISAAAFETVSSLHGLVLRKLEA
jgi:acyl carrier protein